jgi:hypothetical protein
LFPISTAAIRIALAANIKGGAPTDEQIKAKHTTREAANKQLIITFNKRLLLYY